ncbi:uncharacterized protein JNUCC1_03688 [Lentibacillus sp. JNUCC-1]|uniref:DUF2515 family protein n=1 Tax=Lentibacillus sp. JNUCC-1 TaxID=2654513 RepID=UPI0012E7682C|nr:DUF2515 family protein [Lentibacillus sp. JNUCC-1]MUV39804.1 uncharacterized protein [Lentibacillus sp. JNUCC-1]
MLLKRNHHPIHYIIKKARAHNMDNISRTKAYQNFYFHHPEIRWALLASVVSRNAGWNMTDLCLPPYLNMLTSKDLRYLFMTYERANWLIFSDAYPQLLVYERSKQTNQPCFNWLRTLNVSEYIIQEWEHFWTYRDETRLMHALIVNEQNVIENPVIQQSFFKRRVFRETPYFMQRILRMNAVLLPTRSSALYGITVKKFTNLDNRIALGKQLAKYLFESGIYTKVIDFAIHVEHTGSRRDYEIYHEFPFPYAPVLRSIYPVITHHDQIRIDWFNRKRKYSIKIGREKDADIKDISRRYYQKRHLLFAYNHFKQMLT